jgi:hypothetical protein
MIALTWLKLLIDVTIVIYVSKNELLNKWYNNDNNNNIKFLILNYRTHSRHGERRREGGGVEKEMYGEQMCIYKTSRDQNEHQEL